MNSLTISVESICDLELEFEIHNFAVEESLIYKICAPPHSFMKQKVGYVYSHIKVVVLKRKKMIHQWEFSTDIQGKSLKNCLINGTDIQLKKEYDQYTFLAQIRKSKSFKNIELNQDEQLDKKILSLADRFFWKVSMFVKEEIKQEDIKRQMQLHKRLQSKEKSIIDGRRGFSFHQSKSFSKHYDRDDKEALSLSKVRLDSPLKPKSRNISIDVRMPEFLSKNITAIKSSYSRPMLIGDKLQQSRSVVSRQQKQTETNVALPSQRSCDVQKKSEILNSKQDPKIFQFNESRIEAYKNIENLSSCFNKRKFKDRHKYCQTVLARKSEGLCKIMDQTMSKIFPLTSKMPYRQNCFRLR